VPINTFNGKGGKSRSVGSRAQREEDEKEDSKKEKKKIATKNTGGERKIRLVEGL